MIKLISITKGVLIFLIFLYVPLQAYLNIESIYLFFVGEKYGEPDITTGLWILCAFMVWAGFFINMFFSAYFDKVRINKIFFRSGLMKLVKLFLVIYIISVGVSVVLDSDDFKEMTAAFYTKVEIKKAQEKQFLKEFFDYDIIYNDNKEHYLEKVEKLSEPEKTEITKEWIKIFTFIIVFLAIGSVLLVLYFKWTVVQYKANKRRKRRYD